MALSIGSLKIRHQILLITLPPLFALLIAMALCFHVFWLARSIDRTTRNVHESLAQTESVLRHLTEGFMGVRAYLLTRQANQLDTYEKALADVTHGLTRLRQLEQEGDDQHQVNEVDSIQEEVKRWQAEWANPLIARTQQQEEVNLIAVLEEGETRMAALRAKLLQLLDEDRAENEQKSRQGELLLRRMLGLAFGVGVLVAAALIFLTREVTRLITRPLEQLIEASERVSEGDFQPSLPPPVDNEFGVLSRSFTRMTSALREEREEMAALNKFSEAVTQCTSETEVYDHILHSLKERFQPRQAIIFILKSPENFLEAAASLVPLPENVRAWAVIEEPDSCKAVRMGRSFCVNDVTVEPLCPSDFVPPSEGSYYCGPLIAGGIIIGAVRLEGAKHFWTHERATLLESYLSGAATALSNLRLLQRMKQQANVDELTGFYNRRFLEDYARKLLAMADRKSRPLGVIMLDLDHFKGFNDVYGHEVGDRILRYFAKTVTKTMRETNLAARYGGEEFVVLLPDTTSKACLLVAERIRQAVGKMIVPSGLDKPLPQLTVSLGIAIYPEHGRTLEDLLQAADKALYESKRTGRNRSTLYVEQPESTH